MKLKPHGARLVNFVIDYANGDISRWAFDLDYSGYVIDHFPAFQREHPRLAKRFADTIDFTYSNCSWMMSGFWMQWVMRWMRFWGMDHKRIYTDA